MERRFAQSADVTDGSTIYGFASVYDKWSHPLGGKDPFVEKILPGAFRDIFDGGTYDTLGLLNHVEGQEIARLSKRTLRLQDRPEGLYFEMDAPDDELGRYVRSEIRKNRTAGASFAFTVPQVGGDRWDFSTRPARREIIKVDGLYDVSVVHSPAYPDTSVGMRGLRRRVPSIYGPGYAIREPTVLDLDEAERYHRLRRQRQAALRWRFPFLASSLH
jgi:HK97 family phage prohead protease